MGLKLSITKDKNHLHYDFPEAYWKVDEFSISNGYVGGVLVAYPNKESRDNCNTDVGQIQIGGPVQHTVDPKIYEWVFSVGLSQVFGSSIPVDVDDQKTAIYNWIKGYTGLPFEDVFEV